MEEKKEEKKEIMAHKEHHAKKSDVLEIKVPKLTNNPWIIVSVILAIAVVYFLFFNSNGIGEKQAGENLISFINSQGQGTASVVSTEKSDGMYKVTVSYNGQNIPVYVTLDGKSFTTSLIPLAQDNSGTGSGNDPTAPSTQDVPKSDKPKVELFVMSYCPFGTQIEKGILPVASLLKDKIDFQIKFVYYAMHDKKEIDENTIQYCIQKEQKDKFLTYMKCFLTAGDQAGCLTSSGVDKNKVNACVSASDKQFNINANYNDKAKWLSGRYPLYDVDKADNTKYDVGGSPTLIINGVEVQSGRDSPSLLSAVCNSFNNKPKECETQLEAGTPSSGFGWDKASSNNLANCGG